MLCYFIFIIDKIVCDSSYYLLSSSAYSMEFSLKTNFIKNIITMTWLTLAYFITFQKKNGIIFFLRMIIFFTLIPMGSVVWMRDDNILYYSIVMLSFCFVEIYILFLGIARRKRATRVETMIKTDYKPVLTWISKFTSKICLFLCVLLIVLLYFDYGIPKLTALNIYDVYTIRESLNLGKTESYIMTIVTGIIVPFGIADGIEHKKIGKVVFYTVSQFIIYLWTGNKIYAFSLLLIYLVLTIYKLRLGMSAFFLSFTCVGALGCLTSIKNNSLFDTIFSVYNRRMLLDSAALKFFYYDYFIVEGNPIVGVAGTLLAPFIKMGKPNEYRQLLYKKYTGVVSNANTGLFGGDIASLGVLSFFVVPILLIILLQFIQKMSEEISPQFALLLFCYIIYRLNETCIFIFFFDFTGLALFVLVYSYKRINRYIFT